ncbi:MAG: TonB-dependent receptor [Bryobacterales bacterium]|nr:TonB-dependent receptor [Bryobacterales bacterium]
MPGAQVAADGLLLRTDSNGIAVARLPAGKVEIKVHKDGFAPASASLTIDATREWHMLIELQPIEPVKEEITVSATRTDRRIQDSPMRVEVLERDEIEEKMTMSPGDLVMVLNEMGGARVQTTAPSLGAASVRLRGMPGRYTRFFADGLPLYGQQGAGLGVLQIPPMDLWQVEVIKGVSSALYGSGALAGIVNLISRRPGARPALELLTNRSSRGATDAPLYLSSPLGSRWRASLLAAGHGQQQHDADGDGWADLPGYRRGVVRPRLFWDDGGGRTAFLTAGFLYEHRRGGSVPGATLPATGAPYTEALRTRRYDAGGSLQWMSGGSWLATVRFSVSSRHHARRFGDVRERESHALSFAELALRRAFRRHTIVAGIAGERETYRPLDVPRFAYRRTVPGLFLQDDADLTSWFSVSGSARADFAGPFGTFLSPRVSALARWAGWSGRFSLGRGFVLPTPLTEQTEAAGLARLVAPAALRPERGRSLSADLSREMGPLSVTVSAFASSVRDAIEVRTEPGYEIVNLSGASRAAGVELLATWKREPFHFLGSYTYARASKEGAEGRVDLPLTPRHSLAAVGIWESEKGWRVGVEAYYTGRQRLENNPFRTISEPYTVHGLMIERRMGPVRLFFNAENFTDARQTRWEPLLRPSRGADGRWTIDAWAPPEGRVLNGGIRFRW